LASRGFGAASRFILAAHFAIDSNAFNVWLIPRNVVLHRNGTLLALVTVCHSPHKSH
jgi:hypothetical protein